MAYRTAPCGAEPEPLRQVAKTYGVSYEAMRRVLRAARRQENV